AAILAVAIVVTVAWQPPAWRWLDALVLLEIVVAGSMQAADGWVFGSRHVYGPPLLGALWPLAAVLSAGIAWGVAGGTVAGMTVSLARLAGTVAPAVGPPSFGALFGQEYPRLLPFVSVVAFYV